MFLPFRESLMGVINIYVTIISKCKYVTGTSTAMTCVQADNKYIYL